MIRVLIYHLDDHVYRYAPWEEAVALVRSGHALLDKWVLEPDFRVRHITRPEEHAFHREEDLHE